MTWTWRMLTHLVLAFNHHTPKHNFCVNVQETTKSIHFHNFEHNGVILDGLQPTPLPLCTCHEISARLARPHHKTSCSVLNKSHYLQQPRFIPFTSPRYTFRELKKISHIRSPTGHKGWICCAWPMAIQWTTFLVTEVIMDTNLYTINSGFSLHDEQVWKLILFLWNILNVHPLPQ